jgi:hypothetical protein
MVVVKPPLWGENTPMEALHCQGDEQRAVQEPWRHVHWPEYGGACSAHPLDERDSSRPISKIRRILKAELARQEREGLR